MKRLMALLRGSGAAGEGERDRLKEETDKLAKLTDPFAAMRMDRAIQHALSGKTIAELSAGGDAGKGGAVMDR
jgi:hypothetical protein